MADEAKKRLRQTWYAMKDRCLNPNNKKYHCYGGRGITICDRWLASFQAFCDDMGPRPEGLSIDRINNDGNYEPGNCRWADAKTQVLNSRGVTKENAERTHCIHGHELVGENLRVNSRGRRECRACHQRRCVEHRQRAATGVAPGPAPHHNPKKTHCIHGHEFTAENTNVYRGRQKCRACERARDRSHRYE